MSQLAQKLKTVAGKGELLYRNGGVGGFQNGDLLLRSVHAASSYPNHAPPSGWSTAWSVNAPGNWASFSASYRQQHYGAYKIADGNNDGYAMSWYRWTGGPLSSVSKATSTQWTSHPGNRSYNLSSYESADVVGVVMMEGTYLWGKTGSRSAGTTTDNPLSEVQETDYKIIVGRTAGEGVSFTTSGGSASGPGGGYNWWYIGGNAIFKLYA
jgi:hypothetical protein|tara:strand:+ start:57 stop:689 length:633 start_codon:yes stop_codon:yes gene_type:complete